MLKKAGLVVSKYINKEKFKENMDKFGIKKKVNKVVHDVAEELSDSESCIQYFSEGMNERDEKLLKFFL